MSPLRNIRRASEARTSPYPHVPPPPPPPPFLRGRFAANPEAPPPHSAPSLSSNSMGLQMTELHAHAPPPTSGRPPAQVLLELLHQARKELEEAKRDLALNTEVKRELSLELEAKRKLCLELDTVKSELALAQEEQAKYHKSIRNAQEETSCGICGHQMTSSMVLECGHSFCAPCLYTWFRTQLDDHLLKYPRYDPRDFVPEEWIVALQDEDLAWVARLSLISKIDASLLRSAHPHYTCPTCRQRIRSPPIPNIALKQVAHRLDEVLGEESDAEGSDGDAVDWLDLFPVNIRQLELRRS